MTETSSFTDGRLTQFVLDDTADAFLWTTQTTDYAPDGSFVITQVNDDGTVEIL